jgi:hypothetical protein
METLITLPKMLAEVALGILSIKSNDRTRQRLADLLCEVADCTKNIADGVKEGRRTTFECKELSVYANNIFELIKSETDEETARKITFQLNYVSAAPGVAAESLGDQVGSFAKPKWSAYKRFRQADEIYEIAGTIRALGNLVRV